MIQRRVFLLGILIMVAAPFASGADRALLVGVEKYHNPRIPIAPGCAQDALSIANFIQSRLGFPASSIKTLLNEQASQTNIEKEFREWLIEGTSPGDRVFFFFAGRGTQLPDDDGDESDGFDEAIVPYDINVSTGGNAVRDDVFHRFIAQLSGRRAVLMFDCCFSGTMSRGLPRLKGFPQGGGARYLPRQDQFESFSRSDTGAGMRGETPSYILQSSISRDMEHVSSFIDTQNEERISGVVVISAAGSSQLAHPIIINGIFRGALSYVFEEVQKQSMPTLQSLKALITTRIAQMQQTGILEGNQIPRFDVISAVPLDDYPIFGSWEVSPAVALSNPLSKIRVSLRSGEGKSLYRSNETISYEVNTDTPGYLYLIVFSQQNVARCIFPNGEDLNNHMSAGMHVLPRSNAYEFPIMEPFGRDVAVAIVSKESLNLCEKVDYSWSEIFDRLNLRGLQQRVKERATRGVGVKGTNLPQASDWQAATFVTETKQ